jgi:hypothetical protein
MNFSELIKQPIFTTLFWLEGDKVVSGDIEKIEARCFRPEDQGRPYRGVGFTIKSSSGKSMNDRHVVFKAHLNSTTDQTRFYPYWTDKSDAEAALRQSFKDQIAALREQHEEDLAGLLRRYKLIPIPGLKTATVCAGEKLCNKASRGDCNKNICEKYNPVVPLKQGWG